MNENVQDNLLGIDWHINGVSKASIQVTETEYKKQDKDTEKEI